MRIVHKDVTKLSKDEYKAMYSANYGAGGYMREELVNCRHGKDGLTGKTIAIWDGRTKDASNLVGWALLSPTRTWGHIGGSYWNKKRSIYTVQFYIKHKYRKKGYAHKLMRIINDKYDPCPYVFPHNDKSANFFIQYNITASAGDRTWFKGKKKKVAA